MEPINFWKLCDDYSIMHAALIAVGYAPDDVEGFSDPEIENRFPGYIAVRTALCGAIEGGGLRDVREVRHSNDYEDGRLDVRRTCIAVSSLDGYFRARGFSCELFDRSASHAAGDARSPYFSKKLDAANKAWAAVTADPGLLSGKSAKQALVVWLTEHAAELGLLNEDGNPNRSGIEEISKVANWRPEGGATPTPSAKTARAASPMIPLPSPRPVMRPAPPRETFPPDLDDEIPF